MKLQKYENKKNLKALLFPFFLFPLSRERPRERERETREREKLCVCVCVICDVFVRVCVSFWKR